MSSDEVSSNIVAPQPRIRAEILAKMVDVPLRVGNTEAAPADDLAIERAIFATSPIELSRTRVRTICFLSPERIPSAAMVKRALAAGLRTRCLAALDLGTGGIEAAVSVLDAALPAAPRGDTRTVQSMIAANESADLLMHDRFFNIVRAPSPKPGAYVRSALQAVLAFRTELREAPTRLEADKLARIEAGLRRTVTAALGGGAGLAAVSPASVREPAFQDYAARRWIRGHQIFAALTQGLIFAIEALNEAVLQGQPEARAVAADHLVVGLDACAATLELTGDFPAETYEDLIRPSMSLPYLPKGFSGLLSADHGHLVRRMKATRPAMEQLREDDPSRHRAVVEALAGVYDSHKYVCSRFVGTDRSSLLMSKECGRSSLDQLERFKIARLRNLG